MSDQGDPFEIPPRLAEAMRTAFTHETEIPRELDARIMMAARERFARRGRVRMVMRWGMGAAAGIAAVIVVAVSLYRSGPAAPLAKGDVNGDGRVNIVDALVLAKHVAKHDKLEGAWDVNQDGLVDQKDVDLIAGAAVSLKQTGLAARGLPKIERLKIRDVAEEQTTFAGADIVRLEGRQ